MAQLPSKPKTKDGKRRGDKGRERTGFWSRTLLVSFARDLRVEVVDTRRHIAIRIAANGRDYRTLYGTEHQVVEDISML